MTMLGRGKRAAGKADRTDKAGKTDKVDAASKEEKAKKAEEAARRAEELAEQARRAAEEARAALREAERDAGTGEDTEGSGADEGAAGADDALADAGRSGDAEHVKDAGEAADGEGEEEGEEDKAGDDTVADEVKVEEPAEEAGPAAGGRRVVVRAGLGVSGVVLLLVAVLLGAGLGFLVYKDRQFKAAEEARKQVAFAAAQAAQDLSSYDYRTVDSDLRRAAGHTTGKFREEFTRQAEQVSGTAQKQQTVTEGTAIKTGVEQVSGSTAVALVFLNQQTAKGDTAERLPNQYTLRLTMKKVGDRWLVEKLVVM